MKTKVLAILLTLGFALWGAAAWADEFTKVTEPFARSAEIYTEGYHAFAPLANLPMAQDFGSYIWLREGLKWAAPYSPVIQYRLREPERFKFELQTLDPLEMGAPSVGN